MQKTGFLNLELKESDLSDPNFTLENKSFDGIIADVPCSGTGTWARTPDYLHKKNVVDLVEHFVPLQRRIITNILPSLKVNSPLVYITCSVLKKENEENVEYFLNHLSLKLENSDYLEGYTSKGDTLFVARFLKIS